MSKLGNIYNSYGNQFSISIANTYSYNVLNGSNLPNNTIIISSNINDKLEDTGTYSLIVTDYEGTPIRLSYTIQQGNGLSVNDDILYLDIDNKTIKTSSYNSLYIDLTYLIDNSTITYTNNVLSVNVDNIKIADEDNKGILRVDGKTISSDEGKLYVQTSNLEYSNNLSNIYGIFTSESDSLIISNGIVSIDTESLDKCNENEFGIARCDENTLTIEEDGNINLDIDNLDRASNDKFGTIKCSDTIEINQDGEIQVNTNNLNKSSFYSDGIIKIDNDTVILDESGKYISIKDYNKILNDIEKISNSVDNTYKELNKIETNLRGISSL